MKTKDLCAEGCFRVASLHGGQHSGRHREFTRTFISGGRWFIQSNCSGYDQKEAQWELYSSSDRLSPHYARISKVTDLNIYQSKRSQPTRSHIDENLEWQEAACTRCGTDIYSHHFVALQPILDAQCEVFGYESLYRAGLENRFTGDHDIATQTMIDHLLFGGLEELMGGSRAFVNCTRESLVQMSMAVLPTSVVLEVVETIEPDREVMDACRKMKNLGYQIALDDFQPSDVTLALLEIADYVKVDFGISSKEQRREIRRCLTDTTAILVAEKIETREEYELALEEGFRLFQGYYLARPSLFCRPKFPIALNDQCPLAVVDD